MAIIGSFTTTANAITGQVRTLTVSMKARLVPIERSSQNAPDFRVMSGMAEVGAGWKRTGEKAGEYVSLLLDDPVFAQPVRANLFQSGDDKTTWGLHWNRPPKRGERD